MSWFTAPSGTRPARPTCPRCNDWRFVELVRRAGEFDVMDCKSCPTPKNERSKG